MARSGAGSPTWFAEAKCLYPAPDAKDASPWWLAALKRIERDQWQRALAPEEAALMDELQPRAPAPVTVLRPIDFVPVDPSGPPPLLLSINLAIADGVIMRDVKKALGVARLDHPDPARRRGPAAQAGEVGASQFGRWRAHRIVQVADLDKLNAKHGGEATGEQMGRWLFPDEPNQAGRRFIEARNVLNEALACIRALEAQAIRPSE